MRTIFQLAGASVPGTDHTQPGKPFWKNNQDAYFLCQGDEYSIGIVADGCGSGAASEVGAHIGVRILAGELEKQLADAFLDAPPSDPVISWALAMGRLDSFVHTLASSMSGRFGKTVSEFFLFSIVGFVMTEKTTAVFHCGDGSYSVNGGLVKLGPFPNNAPPYLAYRTLHGAPEAVLSVSEYATDDVRTIAIGTDGCDYVPDFADRLSKWTSDDAIFSNPDALRRRLAVMNRERIEDGLLVPGPLRDDTTLVIARRNPSWTLS